MAMVVDFCSYNVGAILQTISLSQLHENPFFIFTCDLIPCVVPLSGISRLSIHNKQHQCSKVPSH